MTDIRTPIEVNRIYCENCLDTMARMPDNSLDAIVTDPPYGISFMGQKWDYDVPSVEIWRECLRVLKPGGYLLAFAGTRTQHRMAINIEDAGFEIRDLISWVYGSGFPKSLNISKAIDKAAGAEREVIGTATSGEMQNAKGQNSRPWHENKNESGKIEYNITAPATDAAKEWEGFGTALKPSWECITVAQKTLKTSSVFDEVFVSLIKQIQLQLCQYQSFVKIAEQHLKSSQRGLSGALNTALWIAENNINTLEDLFEMMDILRSGLDSNTNWSIVLSWLNTLADACQVESMYTTKTESSLIIELRILNCLGWESIFQNIMQANANPKNGLHADVFTAEILFSALDAKLKIIRERFATASAMSNGREEIFNPNFEPITVARKPFKGTVVNNVLEWGTGGLNIDGCRVGGDPWKPHTATGLASVKFFSEGSAAVINKEPHALGRFPANFIHDGSDEVMALFPETTSGASKPEYIQKESENRAMSGKNYERRVPLRDKDTGSAARFFYTAKASASERGKDNTHTTVKPLALMRYLVRLVTPPGGLVYDPFAGSGTTIIAAIEEGFTAIGSDLEPEHCKIFKGRTKHGIQPKMF